MFFLFLFQNSQSCLEAGLSDFSSHSRFKTGNETVLKAFDFTGLFIGGEDNLFIGMIKGIESIKEFFLKLDFVSKHVDIINEEYIHIPESVPEFGMLFLIQCIHI